MSNRTRIIVSDDEDEADEFLHLPPPKDETTPGGMRNDSSQDTNTVGVADNQEDTGKLTTRAASHDRHGSSRSSHLNKSKVLLRQAALEGLRRRSIQGLNALNDSDYDSDEPVGDDDSDSDYSAQPSSPSSSNDDNDDVAPIFREANRSYHRNSRYNRARKSSQAGSSSSSGGNKAANIIARANEAARRDQNSPRRVDPVDIYTSEEEDISNFIVDDDEVDEEMENLRHKRRKDKKRKKESSNRTSIKHKIVIEDKDDDASAEEELDFGGDEKRRISKRSGNKGGKRVRLHDNDGGGGMGDDEDENGVDDDDDAINTSFSSSRLKKVIVESDEEIHVDDYEEDEGEEEEDDEDEDEDEVSDDDDDDEILEGPALYAAVDAMHRKKEESRAKYTKSHYTRAEAMTLYIELLARVHTEPNFLERNEDMHDPRYMQMLAAQKSLEDTICVTRESLCSSGAWNKQFVDEMNSRPFCMINEYAVNCDQGIGEKCAACNRKSDRLHFKMFLFGQRYDAPRLWSAVRWDRELHQSMYYHARNDDAFVSDSDEDSDVADQRVGGWEGKEMATKRWSWWSRNVPMALQGGRDTVLPLGTTCKTRSTLYHHLLHYKFRLLLKVREKLRYHQGDVKELIRDTKFLDTETRRFESILKQANRKWGGSEQRSAGYGMDVWDDDDNYGSSSASTSRRSAASSSTSRTSRRTGGSSVTSMRRWLSQNTDVDIQNQEEVLYDDPIESDDSYEGRGRDRSSTSATPSNQAALASSSSAKSKSIYDDDDGLDTDLQAFGSSCLWERSGSTGI